MNSKKIIYDIGSNNGDEISEHTLLLHLQRSEKAMAEAGGIPIVTDLVNQCPSAINYPYWLAALKDYSYRRESIRQGQKMIISAMDTAQACHEVGIKTVAVTAGYICPEPRQEFYKYIDAANVDLKVVATETLSKTASTATFFTPANTSCS